MRRTGLFAFARPLRPSQTEDDWTRDPSRARAVAHKQHKRRRLRQHHDKNRNRGLALDAPLTALSDDQVLTFLEWCRLNRISERGGRRILTEPGGPVVTQLTPRRVGITVGANRAWQASRRHCLRTVAHRRAAAGDGGLGKIRQARDQPEEVKEKPRRLSRQKAGAGAPNPNRKGSGYVETFTASPRT